MRLLPGLKSWHLRAESKGTILRDIAAQSLLYANEFVRQSLASELGAMGLL